MTWELTLRPNGSLRVRLSPRQGEQWRGEERSRLLCELADLVGDERIVKVVVRDERGVIASLPVRRNTYSQRLTSAMARNLIEIDDREAMLDAWRFLSAPAHLRNEIAGYHESITPEEFKALKAAAPTTEEVARMVAGEEAPYVCPVCGAAAETRIERDLTLGDLDVVLRCENGHETRRDV